MFLAEAAAGAGRLNRRGSGASCAFQFFRAAPAPAPFHTGPVPRQRSRGEESVLRASNNGVGQLPNEESSDLGSEWAEAGQPVPGQAGPSAVATTLSRHPLLPFRHPGQL